jgi:aflatoxin B1 aldehyde reductase
MKLSLGTMVIGDQLDFAASKALLEAWFEAGETEVDTAFLYPAVQHEGRTEALLGEMGLEQLERGVASKANAWTNGGLTGESVVRQLQGSLERLKAKQIDIFYLHMPDPKVPIEETLAAVQKMYEAGFVLFLVCVSVFLLTFWKKGAFRRFGLSNYSSWQVMEIHCYMKARNWVRHRTTKRMLFVLYSFCKTGASDCCAVSLQRVVSRHRARAGAVSETARHRLVHL